MSKIDPEAERKRLADFYTHQLDGELEKVAAQAYDLTEIARDTLRAEMARRGLAVALVDRPPLPPTVPAVPGDPPPELPPLESRSQDGEIEFQKMVTIRQFRDLPEALFAKGSLQSAGIECALLDDNMVRLDWFISNLIGGVKLQVKPEDAAAAEEILSQPIPENFDVPGIGQYDQPHCPKCNSLDVNFQETLPVAYASAWVGMPIPFQQRAWRCRSCKAVWDDTDVLGSADSST